MKNIKFLLFALILISQGIAQTGAWYGMFPAHQNMENGCAITSAGGDTLYALRGDVTHDFYAYIISQDTWIPRANVLHAVNIGGAIIYTRRCSLYATRGNGFRQFYLYRTDNNTWYPRTSAPVGYGFHRGAALCWTGNDTIYAFRGNGTRTFFKYSISLNAWIQQLDDFLPLIADTGASMCWTGGNTIYAILGGGTTQFYRYSISSGTWVDLPNPNVRWQAGASLVWDGATKIYAVAGGGTKIVRVFDITNNQWSSLPDAPLVIGGKAEGAGLLAWDNHSNQKQLYLLRGNNNKEFYRYCLPLLANLPFEERFALKQFPPAGWQSVFVAGTEHWKRVISDQQSNLTAVASFNPNTSSRRAARLILPKFYLGTNPGLVRIQFDMHNLAAAVPDTLLIEYYKPGMESPIHVATFPKTAPPGGWLFKEAIFVETDTIMISFHGISRDDSPLFIDNIVITLDTTKLYSNTYLATAANNSRLLVRKPEHERLHLIFRKATYDATGQPQSQGFLYYSYSDGNDIWSSPILIDTVYHTGDLASNSTITTGVFSSKEPWITYIKSTGSIWVAVQRTNGTWKKIPLFTTGGYVHEPSMAMGLTAGPVRAPDLAYLVFRHRLAGVHRTHFFAFDTTGQKYAEQELDATPSPDPCGRPSIAITPQDLIHIAYTRYESGQDRVYYRTPVNPTNNYQTRTLGVGSWTPRFRVSEYQPWPYTEPATYPSVEAYGQSVFVAWRGKNENGQNIGEIWRRERILPDPYDQWEIPQNMSQSPSNESHYPVMGTRMVTAFQESTAARNKEVYANILDNIVNISQTDSFSFFPHINVEEPPPPPAPYELKVNTIWTERLAQYAYEIKSRRYSYIPFEALSYYNIETGDSIQSPMCQSRDGFIRYPQLPIDFGNQRVSYDLPYLHPLYHHKIKVVVYHRTQGEFKQNFAIDSIPLGSIEYEPNIAETIEIMIPKGSYQIDSRAILEITKNRGQFVTIGKPLIVYRYEVPETTSSSGPQSAGQITVLTKPRLYQNYPNPFKTQTAIQYSLLVESKVSLKIYNVNGRLVKTLIDQHQISGIYSLNWDGKDNLGKTVSSGIYFYRLETDNYQTANRAIIIR